MRSYGKYLLIGLMALVLIAGMGCGKRNSVIPTTTTSLPVTSLSPTAPPATTINTDYVLIRDVEYGRVGSRALLLDIYRPLQPITTPMPAVIWIHGGGWSAGDKYPSMVTLLVKAGFFGVSINYRLSGEAKFPAAVEDCKCAVRWLRANARSFDVDPDRIGAWGGSAGGHLVLMLACADESAGLEGNGGWEGVSSRVQAACSYFGPSDLTGTFGAPAPTQFVGGTPAEKPDAFRLASPLSHVTADDPPLLMAHGDMDKTVPLSQSEIMLEAYQKLGLEAQLIVVKGAGHGFNQVGAQPISPSRPEFEKAVLDFFLKHLVNAYR